MVAHGESLGVQGVVPLDLGNLIRRNADYVNPFLIDPVLLLSLVQDAMQSDVAEEENFSVGYISEVFTGGLCRLPYLI